jgi:hypothetical protein
MHVKYGHLPPPGAVPNALLLQLTHCGCGCDAIPLPTPVQLHSKLDTGRLPTLDELLNRVRTSIEAASAAATEAVAAAT